MRLSRFATLALAAAMFVSIHGRAEADTLVSGTLAADTTWTVADSPFIVWGRFTIPAGRTLVIEPGVVVRFEHAAYLFVSGTLVARGTADQKIRFTSTQTPATPGWWRNVWFDDSSTDAALDETDEWIAGSVLSHLIVEGAGFSETPHIPLATIYANRATPLIEYVTIRDSGGAGIGAEFGGAVQSGLLVIRHCDLIGSPNESLPHSYSGIKTAHLGQVLIEFSSIRRYRSAGIDLYTFPLQSTPMNVTVRGNVIEGNDVGLGAFLPGPGRFEVTANTIHDNGVGVSYNVRGGVLTFAGNVVTGNQRRGVRLDGNGFEESTFTVTNNVIADNTGDNSSGLWTGDAGGLHLENHGTSVVTNNVLSSNTASSLLGAGGSVFRVINGTLTFARNLVANNVGFRSGAVRFDKDGASSINVSHNTFTGNVALEATDSDAVRPSAVKVNVYWPGGAVTVGANNLFGNVSSLVANRYALYVQGWELSPVDARGNWWGTANLPLAQSQIWSNPITVLSNPILTSLNTDAPVSPPTGLTVTRNGTEAEIRWNSNPESDVAGYRIWYGPPGSPWPSGTEAAEGASPIDVGNATSYRLTNLPADSVVAVSAYDIHRDGMDDQTDGHESWHTPVPRAPLAVTSLTVDRPSPQMMETYITFTATAAGGVPEYQYQWRVWDGIQWTTVRQWSASRTFTWYPTAPNSNYRVAVRVRSFTTLTDGPDNAASEAALDFPIVGPLFLSFLAANREAPQPINTAITFTASAFGGFQPVEYKWWVFNGTTWTAATGWVTSRTFTWAPTVPHPGYRVGVWLRNAGSTADAYANAQANGSIPFAITPERPVSPLLLTGLTANRTAPQPVSSAITFTAATSGGLAPVEYKWWVFNGAAWTAVTGWVISNSFTWTPTAAHLAYRIGVWLRNAGSTADAYDNGSANGSIPFAITAAVETGAPLALTSLTANRTAPQPVNTSTTFAAATSGGIAPIEYKWWVFNGATWAAVTGWSVQSTFTWTPATAHSGYRVGVWLRNAGSTADAYANASANGSIPFAITASVDTSGPLALTGLTTNVTAPQPTNTWITVTATVSGGVAPVQYKWWVFNGTSWTSDTGWVSANSFIWSAPTAHAGYRVGVWLRNAGSTADAYDNDRANGSIPFPISP